MILGTWGVTFWALGLTFGLRDLIFGRRKRVVGNGMRFVGSWGRLFGLRVAKMSDDSFSCGPPGLQEGVGGG